MEGHSDLFGWGLGDGFRNCLEGGGGMGSKRADSRCVKERSDQGAVSNWEGGRKHWKRKLRTAWGRNRGKKKRIKVSIGE